MGKIFQYIPFIERICFGAFGELNRYYYNINRPVGTPAIESGRLTFGQKAKLLHHYLLNYKCEDGDELSLAIKYFRSHL